MLEYNASFGPDESITIPLDANLDNAPKGYHGASLSALANLANKKEYRLVACDFGGSNAFFLRHDVAVHIPEVDVSNAYMQSVSRKDPFGQQLREGDVLGRIEELGLPLVQV